MATNVKQCGNREAVQGVAVMADTERERMVVEERASHLELPSARGFNAGAPGATDCSKSRVHDSPKLLPCETPKDEVFARPFLVELVEIFFLLHVLLRLVMLVVLLTI
jgi:hypothetical protein